MKKREPPRWERNKPKETRVLLWEEYGYHVYLWCPEMTPQQLIAWWKELECCPEMSELPGRVIKITPGKRQRHDEVQESGEAFEGHIHMNDDSYLRTPQGEMIMHKGRLARDAKEEQRRARH